MKNKGFTLIELLAVIVILTLILMIVVPSVLKSFDNSKKNIYEVMVDNICKSTSSYIKEYQEGLISMEDCDLNNGCEIKIKDLMKQKYLSSELENPLTGKPIDQSEVEINAEKIDGDIKVYVTIDEDTRNCDN